MLTPKLTPEDAKLCCVIAAACGQAQADAITRLINAFKHDEYDEKLRDPASPSNFETFIKALEKEHAFDSYSESSLAAQNRKRTPPSAYRNGVHNPTVLHFD